CRIDRGPHMVASLLRLRLHGLGNRLVQPRSRAEQVTSLLGLVAVIAAIAGIVLLGAFAARTTPELRHVVFVAIGSLVVAGFWLAPFVVRTSGGLEPRAFATVPVPPGRLSVALAVSALASVPAVLLAALLIAYIAAWSA